MFRDLSLRQPVVEGQLDREALFGGKVGQGEAQTPPAGFFGPAGFIWESFQILNGIVALRGRRSPGVQTKSVQCQPPGDGQQPGKHPTPVRVEGLGPGPQPEERVLGHFLRGHRVSQHPQRKAVDSDGVFVV